MPKDNNLLCIYLDVLVFIVLFSVHMGPHTIMDIDIAEWYPHMALKKRNREAPHI